MFESIKFLVRHNRLLLARGHCTRWEIQLIFSESFAMGQFCPD